MNNSSKTVHWYGHSWSHARRHYPSNGLNNIKHNFGCTLKKSVKSFFCPAKYIVEFIFSSFVFIQYLISRLSIITKPWLISIQYDNTKINLIFHYNQCFVDIYLSIFIITLLKVAIFTVIEWFRRLTILHSRWRLINSDGCNLKII